MELVDVVAVAHFENSEIGAVSRKQRLRVSKRLADYLESLGLVTMLNVVPIAKREYTAIDLVEPLIDDGEKTKRTRRKKLSED